MSTGILISNYNNGPWLRECVDSALAQTLPADEVIVYDDGSTDESIAILRAYGDRIRLIEGAHRFDRSGLASQAAAVEAAFAVSTSEHIYLLDGDDRYKPHHLAACETVWRKAPEAVMVQVAVQYINESGHPGRVLWPSRNQQKNYRHAIYRHQNPALFSPTSGLAFSRSLLLDALPLQIPQTGITSATDMRLCWAAALGGRILWLAEAGVDYRQRAVSLAVSTGYKARTIRQNTEMMIGDFNDYARRRGHPKVKLWRNYAIQKQFLRGLLPRALGDALAQTKLRLTRSLRDREGRR